MSRPVARGVGARARDVPITSSLCHITRPWAPSALLTPSTTLIHDLGAFNIYICCIWHKVTQNDANFAQNQFFPKSQREFITSFAITDLSWVTFSHRATLENCVLQSLAIFWIRAWWWDIGLLYILALLSRVREVTVHCQNTYDMSTLETY